MNPMTAALEQAKKVKGEIAVGAAIVKDNKIIALASNSKEASNDVTAHAEILAIRKAAQNLRTRGLVGGEQ